MKKTYSELLRDPRWQRRRLEILSRSNFTCERCKSAEKTLNVHHKLYRKGASPWEYADHELQSLCEDCHEAEHHVRSALMAAVAQLDQRTLDELLGFAEAAALECGPDIAELRIRSFSHGFGVLRRFNIQNYEAAQEVLQSNVSISVRRLKEIADLPP